MFIWRFLGGAIFIAFTFMKKIYIFGNDYLENDSLPIKLKPKLEKIFPEIKFIIQDPNENLRPENGELFIIDTVIGPNKVVVIEDIEKIEREPSVSMHDFDLGFNLKLLKKIGLLKKTIIIGIPSESNLEEVIFDEVVKKIKLLTPMAKRMA